LKEELDLEKLEELIEEYIPDYEDLLDTEVLFDVMKHYNDITVKQLSLDTSNYLVVPSDRSNYGGAWTLIPKGGTYESVHEEIERLLN